jgi:hypothetical protein
MGLVRRAGLVASLAFVLVIASCSSDIPTAVPGQVIHVVNDSDRAVMVASGNPLQEQPTTAARPCGGAASLAVTTEAGDDGRVMAFLSVDPNGAFDAALKAYEGDPLDMPGTFSATIIWSDGTLAGRLPIYLTVAPDLTVTASATPGARPTSDCIPAF